MIYLGTPYSHPNGAIRHARFQVNAEYVANCVKRGEAIFSPIIHWHYIAKKYSLPKDFSFWKNLDLTFLSACSSIHVLELPGHEESVGLQAEIQQAEEWQMAIHPVDPSSLTTFHEFSMELKP